MILLISVLVAVLSMILVFLLVFRYQNERIYEQINRRLNTLRTDTEQNKMLAEQKKNPKAFDISLFARIMRPIWENLQKKLVPLAPSSLPALIERRIVLAGKQGVWSVNFFVVMWVLCVAIFSIGTFLFLTLRTDVVFIQKVAGTIIGGLVGSFVPFAILNSMIQKRQKLIIKQMPDFLDMLCVSVQAGLSFEGALSKLTARMKGPLVDEFKRVQRDETLGISKKIALQNMSKRCDVEEVYLFITSLIQSEKLGTSIAKTLLSQADNMRDRHRQFVKAEALKAPIKIIFPLVFFIFPVIFVIVLLPSLLGLMRDLQ